MGTNNYVWNLMARVLSNEASEQERKAFSDMLQQDAQLQQQYSLLQQIWHPSTSESFKQNTSDRILAEARLREEQQSYIQELPVQKRIRSKKIYWWAAAASLLVAVFAVALFNPSDKNVVNISSNSTFTDSVKTAKGNRSLITLPDGSRVWLNSGTRIYYQKDFTGKTREVQIEGEAFFDVIRMPDKPFIVHASDVNIRVLGTMFNVKSYPTDKDVETTLLHGSVAVTRLNDPSQRIITLVPNQKIRIRKMSGKTEDPALATAHKNDFIINTVDSTIKPSHLTETSWVYNRLEFRGDEFTDLAERLERWYNIRIIFKDEKVKKLRFNGSFENETPEQAFKALQSVALFTFKIKDNEISVSSYH